MSRLHGFILLDPRRCQSMTDTYESERGQPERLALHQCVLPLGHADDCTPALCSIRPFCDHRHRADGMGWPTENEWHLGDRDPVIAWNIMSRAVSALPHV